MMFEWYSMLAYTRRPAREQAFAKTSAEALIPLPWGPPIIQVSRLFCTRNTYSSPRTGTKEPYMATVAKEPRMATRREKDTLGEVDVPADALWGAQTQRGLENYQVSGYRPFAAF